MARIMCIDVGDKVVKLMGSLGEIHAEIYSKRDIGDGMIDYTLKLTPINTDEETLLLGMISYNEKCGCNYWSLTQLNDGTILSYGNHRRMFRVDII